MLSVPYSSYSILLDAQRPRSLTSSSSTTTTHPHIPHTSKLKTLVHNKQSTFLVKLTVHDITNVPLVSGSFSTRWKFRGSKGDMGLEREQQAESPSTTLDPTHLTPHPSSSSSSSIHETFTNALGDLAQTNNPGVNPGVNVNANVHSGDWAARSASGSVSTTRSSTPGIGAPGVPPPRGGGGSSLTTSHHQPSLSNASSIDTRSTMSAGTGTSAPGTDHHSQTVSTQQGSDTLALFVDHEMARFAASNNNPVPSNIPKFTGEAGEQGVEGELGEGEDEEETTTTRKRDRARERLHVPHILLHRSENGSHSSLSSAFGSLGRKRRGEEVGSGSASGSASASTSTTAFGGGSFGRARSGSGSGSRTRVASLTSIASSLDSMTRTNHHDSSSGQNPTSSTTTTTTTTRDHPEGIKLDVPLGTVTTVKGRTPVKELEDHGVSWEYHIAQVIKIKLRPLDEETLAVYAKRFAAGGAGMGLGAGAGTSGGIKEHAKQFGASLIPSSSSASASTSTPSGTSSPPKSSTTNGSSTPRSTGTSQPGGQKKRSSTGPSPSSTNTEPQGWLGGGPTSESGLKLVVYQHSAGMGLETIQSVSTRSDGDEDVGMDFAKQGAGVGRARSILHPTRTNKHKHRGGSGGGGEHLHGHLQDPGIYFGELNLDLAEYASDEGRMGRGGVTRRYLLKGGKTNAMIKLTIELKHISGERCFITPPLQRGAGITGAIDNDLQIDHHLNKLKTTENSASSSSVSLAQSQNGSMVSRAPTHEHEQLLRTVSCTTLPPSEQSRTRPKKPPESHFLEPEHQHRFNQLYRRGYRNHGHRAVHDALKSGHRDHHRHRQSAPYTGDWSAEQVIDLIFNPLPVNRIDKVTPFTYYAENAPDDESTGRNAPDSSPSGGGQGAETASLAESTNTLQEKRSRKFLHVLGGHGLRSYSSSSIARDEGGNGTGEKSRPRWTRGKTKLNE